ncbi:MAG: 50S ribosomal protein L24 [Nonlabens sp.]|jgi:large subunit ribosomal protein L24|uniref:50S ribosomal protein L24 n=1 Tax=Nonlabens sp. TaxID=1888209 RepID=UPI00321B5D69
MAKLKIKTGDIVRVLAGEHKGSEGKVSKVFIEKNKAIVEGVNLVSKHEKPSATNPQGGIKEKEAPLHISNLSLIDGNGKSTRIGYQSKDGKNVRFAKTTKEVI